MSNQTFYDDLPDYSAKLLTVVKEMIRSKQNYSVLLRDFVACNWINVNNVLEDVIPQDFGGLNYAFLVEALEIFLSIEVAIWYYEHRINQLQFGSPFLPAHKDLIKTYEERISRLGAHYRESDCAFKTLQLWVETDDLVYTRLSA